MAHPSWARAIFRRWWALLSSAVLTLVGLYALITNKSPAWIIAAYLVCAVLFFGIAAHGAWRDERTARLDAEGRLDEKHKIRRAKESIGRLLEQIAQYEREALNGSSGSEYDKLYQQIEQIKRDVHQIATEDLDMSFESRFLAVNVHDIQLDEATKVHFISRAQGSFWTMYQQLKGWRACLVDILRDMGH